MSPSVFISKNNPKSDKEIQKYKETRLIISKYQKFIKQNFEYVGDNFAHEARSINYKNKKVSKKIYGIATKEDLKELKEEGIETEVIPWIEDNTN